jgi:hypothetical protein
MTCLEKFRQNYPDNDMTDEEIIHDMCPDCSGVGIMSEPDGCPHEDVTSVCTKCWNRQIPGTEPTGEKTPFTEIDKHIDLFPDPEGMERVAADVPEGVGSVAQFLDPQPIDTTDAVNHPKHYGREGAMECIDEMVLVFGKKATMWFCLLNSWKYRYRAGAKGGDEDLRKSDWYLAKYAELKGGD